MGDALKRVGGVWRQVNGAEDQFRQSGVRVSQSRSRSHGTKTARQRWPAWGAYDGPLWMAAGELPIPDSGGIVYVPPVPQLPGGGPKRWQTSWPARVQRLGLNPGDHMPKHEEFAEPSPDALAAKPIQVRSHYQIRTGRRVPIRGYRRAYGESSGLDLVYDAAKTETRAVGLTLRPQMSGRGAWYVHPEDYDLALSQAGDDWDVRVGSDAIPRLDAA